ncbi:hypothetical protein C8R46DRAFT_426344 [Mycena filopes]|nr:hypothetical protein C8R46DRAFT_426344 [Mycena filopes]
MLQLSPELLLEILDVFAIPLALQTQQTPHRAALSSCSLVCKNWATPSQRLLFERVQIDEQWAPGMFSPRPSARIARSLDRLGSFLRTISAENDKFRWLRESVRSIHLRPHSSAKSADIMAILTQLPNLRELDIIGAACSFSEAELEQLRRSGPAIRSLRVNTDHSGSITSMGAPAWPAVSKVIAAIPTLRMLDIATNNVQELPLFTPPLQLQLVSFKLSSQWVTDASRFVASLGGGPLELFYQTDSRMDADLMGIVSAHGAHLRSLSMQEPDQSRPDLDLGFLQRCTQLERFESQKVPSAALLAAIPPTITALSVLHPYRLPPKKIVASTSPTGRQTFRTVPAYNPPTAEGFPEGFPAVKHLAAQLDTFPRLRMFSWVSWVASEPGAPVDPNAAILKDRCAELGIEFRTREIGSLSDDEVQFSLRRRLLAL